MKIKNLKLKILLVMLVVLAVSPNKARAEELSLSVYPPLIHIKAVTPDDIKTPLTIQNLSNNPVSLQISFRPFTASRQWTGEIRFITDGRFNKLVENKQITVLDGDSPVSEIEVGAKQSKTLSLSINLFQEEKASDYYFSVVFVSRAVDFSTPELSSVRSKNNLTTAQTFISMGVATNVLLSVNPAGEPKVNIEEFSTAYLIDQGPVAFKVQVGNAKEFAAPVEGAIFITNMFGQTVGKIDLPSSYVLNYNARIFPDTKWEEKFLLGYYTATLNLKLDNNQPFITKTISFIAIPFQNAIMAITALGIVLLIRARLKAKPRLTRLIKNKNLAETT